MDMVHPGAGLPDPGSACGVNIDSCGAQRYENLHTVLLNSHISSVQQKSNATINQ